MEIVAALLTGAFLVAAQLGAQVTGDSEPRDRARSALATLTPAVDGAVGELEQARHSEIREPHTPVRVTTRSGRVVVAPGGCASLGGPYDLTVFFHGAPTAVEPAFKRAGINGVLVVINLGIASGPYQDEFRSAGSFAQLLERTARIIQDECPRAADRWARVAVAAWSAGYGAVASILHNEQDRELLDAVLLADGLHAGYLEDRRGKRLNPAALESFVRLADEAIEGERLFALTHTEIPTPGYASTSETADYLLQQTRLARRFTVEPGPRPKMRMLSHAEAGAFFVRGFAGSRKHDHADHLLGIDGTLLPLLRDWWEERLTVAGRVSS
jgi:hypothetical protein